MNDTDRDTAQKKPYSPPEVRRVELRPEEAVLGFCKTAGIAGPLGGDCTIPASCFSSGS